MKPFDFQDYFRQLDAAETDEARQAVRQQKLTYVSSLSETEKQDFKQAYEQFMRSEIDRFRRMADQAEEMFGVKRAA
jgi:hypothetical protein